ncbi:hypothetical protein WICMUC_004463 [Wickerhamomyces mucosus]|uniref:Uncharacterized protein n=1 Tax=Wickerhamomyces mucosus TaxID=1378264 RepID=A0A9P8PHB0_9ASCO|nr:hypothetical protein WICMUC_004463 [Wickerhamomyces mucosus]
MNSSFFKILVERSPGFNFLDDIESLSGKSIIEGSSPVASSITFDLGNFSDEKFGRGFFFNDFIAGLSV